MRCRALLAALLLLAGSRSGGAATQRLFADDETSLAENAKQCMFLYKGLSKYVYALKVRAGSACSRGRALTPHTQGLQAPGGYYRVTQPVGEVAYTFWFQVCSNMLFSRDDLDRPGVRPSLRPPLLR
jgi:hypothetical protein